jgi:hypothetical protein
MRVAAGLTGWGGGARTGVIRGALQVGILVACLVVGVPAGGAESTVIVELLVPPIQRLQVEPILLELPMPTAADLRRGHLDLAEPAAVRIRSNAPWRLSMRLAAAAGVAAGAGAAAKNDVSVPLRVQWVDTDGRVSEISEQWLAVASGGATLREQTVAISLRVPLSWTTAHPGESELRIDYRLEPVPGGSSAD